MSRDKLSIKEIEAAKPREKPYRPPDGGGGEDLSPGQTVTCHVEGVAEITSTVAVVRS